MNKNIRDFVVLPLLVLSCLFLIILAVALIDKVFLGSGNLFVDVFLLLLLATPFYLLTKFLWNKAEDINVKQHIDHLNS